MLHPWCFSADIGDSVDGYSYGVSFRYCIGACVAEVVLAVCSVFYRPQSLCRSREDKGDAGNMTSAT